MPCFLHPIATALPDVSLPQEQTFAIANAVCDAGGRARAAEAVYRKTGVDRRGSVLFEAAGPDSAEVAGTQSFYPSENSPSTGQRMAAYDRHARRLARRSAAAAIGHAELAAGEITHLVSTTCTGFSAPGWELSLFDTPGLSTACPRTQIGFMGCHAAFNAVRAAAALSVGGPVLVCCTELCSLHMHYGWDSDKVVANALFADGSAALVCSDRPQNAVARFRGSASHVEPGTGDLMGWTVGDRGFEMTLSPEVADVVSRRLPAWVDGVLAEHNLARDDVAGWACHPGGPRILTAVEESLSLPADALDASRGVLRDLGNMSSPTILFVLERMRPNVRGPVVALGFGPGLTFEAMILDVL